MTGTKCFATGESFCQSTAPMRSIGFSSRQLNATCRPMRMITVPVINRIGLARVGFASTSAPPNVATTAPSSA